MILVTLGTQDKPFTRLLKAVETEIKNGTIKDKVVVQAGFTKYSSKYMEIFDLVSMDEFDKLLDKAEFVITHGGVGSILGALRKNKKVIAVARTAKYREHTNDHQKQIVDSFSKSGYILECVDLDHLSDAISKIDSFKPKKYKAGNKKMLDIITNFIE